MPETTNKDSTNVTRNSISYMRDAVLFEGPERGQRLSRFWILLTLASVIAAAGVVADSTATVIGAMIIAPMMLPIQGTMLSTVLGDHVGLIRSIVLMATGAVAAVAVGFFVGMLVPSDIVTLSNNQIAGRVHPGLLDLLAALATGVVGSIALIRRDISDALPGVAIAISLVPPLVVAGITLETGAIEQALGAMLLFVTNVASILATGVVVMTLYKIHPSQTVVTRAGQTVGTERKAVIVTVGILAVVAIPLTASSIDMGSKIVRESTIRSVTEQWATESEWELLKVESGLNKVTLRLTGQLPTPDTDELAKRIAEKDIDTTLIEVEFLPANTVMLSNG